MLIEFVVPGQPVAKARPRVTSYGHTYTPKKTKLYERMVSGLARKEWMFEPMTGPLKLTVVCVFQRPKRLMRKSDPDERVWMPKRPDLDNVCKAINDGLEVVMKDDAQIVIIEARKYYAAKGEEPHVCVRLEHAV